MNLEPIKPVVAIRPAADGSGVSLIRDHEELTAEDPELSNGVSGTCHEKVNVIKDRNYAKISFSHSISTCISPLFGDHYYSIELTPIVICIKSNDSCLHLQL